MRCERAAAFLAVFAFSGCGGKSNDRTPAEIVLSHPELAPTPERFASPPEPCSPDIATGAPVLPLPWGRRVETYFPPQSTASDLALDYEVVPLARVDRVSVTFDYDDRKQPDDAEIEAECPALLSQLAWLPPAVSDDVVRVRVDVTDSDGAGRSADVFASVGPRTIQVPLDGVDLSSTASNWYVLFEPAWGTPRIALSAVPSPAGASIALPSLPSGPGRIALVETAAVVAQDDAVTLHAPGGFAGDVAAYVTGWYQSILAADDEQVEELELVVPPGSTPRYGSLGAALVWAAGEPPLVITVPSASGAGDLAVSCGAAATVVVTGFAKVKVSVAGGATLELEPGSAASPSSSCAAGADHVTWHFETKSLNGRGSDLVVREGAP